MAIWLASCRYAGATTKGRSVASQNTISSGLRRICFSKYLLAFAKQARRAPHQDADHHQIDQECAEPRKVILPRHVADAEHRGGDERAADRAQAADRDDDQHVRSEEHTSELQSRVDLVCRLLLEKKKIREEALAAAWEGG